MIRSMPQLSRLSDRTAVERAMDEYDQIGDKAFLEKYGHDPNKGLVVIRNGERYDSKAIFGAAWGYQFPEEGPLAATDFSGGYATVVKYLERLGFKVIDLREENRPTLTSGRSYSWSDLGQLFDFRPAYLAVAGGMISRPAHDAVLLITHPGGAKSFDYNDYWDGGDLIYTGRGKHGHQLLDGANADVADNRRAILAFEQAGPSELTYLGRARCVEWWPDTGPDSTGEPRRIYRFRLRFDAAAEEGDWGPDRDPIPPAAPLRRSRPFDKHSPPSNYRTHSRRANPEETRALQEKATRAHHDLLVELVAVLERCRWTQIEEIPAAVDLWARPTNSDADRVIFEAKTISPRSTAARVRGALAQLLEYRFFWGDAHDQLCVVTNAPVPDERIRFLRTMGVDVMWFEGGVPVTRGASRNPSVAQLLADEPVAEVSK
jgi:hypothetical protein